MNPALIALNRFGLGARVGQADTLQNAEEWLEEQLAPANAVLEQVVPLAVVNNLIGSSTVILWKKLEIWVEDLRGELDSPFAFEWFQWLAMTLSDLQDDADIPAYEAHTEWEPSNLSSEI